MRISDWSSDVCSSDLQFLIDERTKQPLDFLVRQEALVGLWPGIEPVRVEGGCRMLFQHDARHPAFTTRTPFQEAAEFSRHLVRTMLGGLGFVIDRIPAVVFGELDRKSTRLNSSH